MFGIVSVKRNDSKYFFTVLIYSMKIFLFGLLKLLEEAQEDLWSCFQLLKAKYRG